MPGNVGSVVFAINGKRHAINVNGGDVSPSTTLYDYLRQGTSCTVRPELPILFCAVSLRMHFKQWQKPVTLHSSLKLADKTCLPH